MKAAIPRRGGSFDNPGGLVYFLNVSPSAASRIRGRIHVRREQFSQIAKSFQHPRRVRNRRPRRGSRWSARISPRLRRVHRWGRQSRGGPTRHAQAHPDCPHLPEPSAKPDDGVRSGRSVIRCAGPGCFPRSRSWLRGRPKRGQCPCGTQCSGRSCGGCVSRWPDPISCDLRSGGGFAGRGPASAAAPTRRCSQCGPRWPDGGGGCRGRRVPLGAAGRYRFSMREGQRGER